ncbi:TPA: hypothetical protein HA344_07410 [Candidatus Bathyarchaeota archaeon]|nr:hypothetical protein [Candidatus Bathyarchaeota archaeon]
MNARFHGDAMGECAVITGGYSLPGSGSVRLRGTARNLVDWFYPGGYLSEDMDAFGVLRVNWVDESGAEHALVLNLYAVGAVGGWVNEGGHFAVWSNMEYSGVYRTGSGIERVTGSFLGGPYCSMPREPVDMAFVAQLRTPDGSWLFIVWSRVDLLLTAGFVYDGAYNNVVIPEDIYLPACKRFNFETVSF